MWYVLIIKYFDVNAFYVDNLVISTLYISHSTLLKIC